MKAVILAAGQGRRLLPRTHDLPKCLLSFAGRPLLAWQLDALARSAVEEAVIVTGFGAEAVERALARLAPPRLSIRTLFNPFYSVADNVASCWMARAEFTGEVIILNGDVLFSADIPALLREQATYPITVTTDEKEAYDADDMKVELEGRRVIRIGKQLTAAASHAESIGMLLLRGIGGQLFAQAVEAVMAQPGGVGRWYLSAVDDLAAQGLVGAASIAGVPWAEVDYPADIARADLMARRMSSRIGDQPAAE